MTGLAEAIEGRRPLPTIALGSFSLGMIGDRIFRDAPALLLLIFMTGYLGVPPAMAGTAVFVPKVLIMLVDPMVGTLSDRLHTRWGRRVPLMFIGALLSSVSVVLFFHAPHLPSPALEATYMSGLIFVGFTGYSLYSVPYLTMASEIANGEEERRRIMSWRVMSMAVGLCFSAFAGALVQGLGGGIAGYATMSWIYGGICLLTMMGTVIAAARMQSLASGGAADEAAASLLLQVRGVAANRQYLRLLTVCFAQKLGEGVGYGSFAYFCIYVVQQPLSGIGLVVLASVAGQLVSQPTWLWASRRWSPPALCSVGVLGWCLNLVLWLAMRGQSSWWLLPLGLESGVAAGGFLMVTLAMLSEVLAADRVRTRLNRDGIYSGVWSAMEKFAFAMGALPACAVYGSHTGAAIGLELGVGCQDGDVLVRCYGDSSRPAVLLAHDAPGTGLGCEALARALAEEFYVLAPDLPGCGESSAPAEGPGVLAASADALAAVADRFGLARYVVAGLGCGSAVAACLAERDAGRMVGVVVRQAPGPDAATAAAIAPEISLSSEGAHWVQAWLMIRDAEIYRPWFAGTVAAQRREQGNFDAQWLHDQTCALMAGRGSYHLLPRAAWRFDTLAALRDSSVPVEVLRDGADVDAVAARLRRLHVERRPAGHVAGYFAGTGG